MEPRDDPRLKQILDEAATIPPDERSDFLSRTCGGDAALRNRVEGLLDTPRRPDPRREKATLAQTVPPPQTAQDPGANRPAAAAEDRQIGPYKLVEKIGEGGMGIVYLAQQERPIRRQVALKIIKLGMDTRQIVARFEAERQALAMMEHPSIAKVLDAGATPAGRPYFVMELVRGVPITNYCDTKKLTTLQRLELFIPVCKAVQHAHQKGIIHRDIKPSNVLVTVHDGVAVPKVIDFGIAKATRSQLTEKTLVTEVQQFLGTPQYMAPEQADMSGLDVDTRADVYALGVLLYELLTGTTPIEAQMLRAAGYAEMHRIIREVDPPRPSTRIGKLDDKTATQIADHRRLPPGKLQRQVRGELDWIAMKALEKDRTRRYVTASDLAADVTHYLHHEPVEASPPSKIYRMRKLARRYRAAVLIGVSFALLLVAATAVSLWEATRAHRAAIAAQISQAKAQDEAVTAKNAEADAVRSLRRANRETATAKNIANYLEDLIASANPITGLGANSTMKQMLDEVADSVQTQFANDPEVESELQIIIGQAYRGWGEADLAKPHFARALELRRRVFGENSVQYATSLLDYSLYEPQPKEEADVREALRIYQAKGETGIGLLRSINRLQRVLLKQKSYDEVEALGNEAFAIAKQSGGESPALGFIYENMANVELARANYAAAEKLCRSDLGIQMRLGTPIEIGASLTTLSEVLRLEGRLPEAVQEDQRALADLGEAYPTGNAVVRASIIRLRRDIEFLANKQQLHLAYDSPAKIGNLEILYRELRSKVPNEANGALRALIGIESDLGREYASAGDAADAQAMATRCAALQASLTNAAAPEREATSSPSATTRP